MHFFFVQDILQLKNQLLKNCDGGQTMQWKQFLPQTRDVQVPFYFPDTYSDTWALAISQHRVPFPYQCLTLMGFMSWKCFNRLSVLKLAKLVPPPQK